MSKFSYMCLELFAVKTLAGKLGFGGPKVKVMVEENSHWGTLQGPPQIVKNPYFQILIFGKNGFFEPQIKK